MFSPLGTDDGRGPGRLTPAVGCVLPDGSETPSQQKRAQTQRTFVPFLGGERNEVDIDGECA